MQILLIVVKTQKENSRNKKHNDHSLYYIKIPLYYNLINETTGKTRNKIPSSFPLKNYLSLPSPFL